MAPPRILTAGLTALAVLVTLILAVGRDDGGTDVRLVLDNAGGLQDGSAVSIGGVPIGKVSLELAAGDKVIVKAHIKEGHSVPRDARAAITAVNFLGTKQVAFSGGDRSRPAPDGYEFAASRVSTSTDLDQVLNTLDADTRTRLSILVNEAGASVLGRRWDISRFVQEAPTTIADADRLLERLIRDNRTLAELVGSSDRVVASATAKRAALVRMVDTVGRTAETVEARREDLRATLAKAPRTLATLQRFLGQLQRTTVPLEPAAREIAAAAPALDQTLAEVDGFRRSADPTLRTATTLAPRLTELAAGATPVLRAARAPVRSLAALATALKPVSTTLDSSADNLLATIENWSQAIQLRDGVSHIFRGEATFSPDLLTSALDRLMKPAEKQAARRTGKHTPAGRTAAAAPAAPAAAPAAARPGVLDEATRTTDEAVGRAQELLKQLLPGTAGAGAAQPKAPAGGAAGLLDFLLGS